MFDLSADGAFRWVFTNVQGSYRDADKPVIASLTLDSSSPATHISVILNTISSANFQSLATSRPSPFCPDPLRFAASLGCPPQSPRTLQQAGTCSHPVFAMVENHPLKLTGVGVVRH